MRKRNTKRHSETERRKERQILTDRQTDRRKEKQTDRKKERQSDGDRGIH